ncbi:MAG: hypothetical protein KC736_00350 [Candidatus Moranbacteria bacterium]|nr:hypothetical protein [Candidatus Moranbacteria bacterium]
MSFFQIVLVVLGTLLLWCVFVWADGEHGLDNDEEEPGHDGIEFALLTLFSLVRHVLTAFVTFSVPMILIACLGQWEWYKFALIALALWSIIFIMRERVLATEYWCEEFLDNILLSSQKKTN